MGQGHVAVARWIGCELVERCAGAEREGLEERGEFDET